MKLSWLNIALEVVSKVLLVASLWRAFHHDWQVAGYLLLLSVSLDIDVEIFRRP